MYQQTNPFFSFLSGPHFLLLVAGLGIGMAVMSRIMRLIARMGDRDALREIQAGNPVVYEAAYLRGRMRAVIETAVFRLALMELLHVNDAGSVSRASGGKGRHGDLDPIEREEASVGGVAGKDEADRVTQWQSDGLRRDALAIDGPGDL